MAVSAHKWLFQPKESALVLFRDAARAHGAMSFGGGYLAAPNVGLLGSHGATAVPLLALLLAWGREGLAARVERCMAAADRFAAFVEHDARLELFAPHETGVVLWRPRAVAPDALAAALPAGLASAATVAGEPWLRCVAANPNVNPGAVIAAVEAALERVGPG